jgi:hypothetical protein
VGQRAGKTIITWSPNQSKPWGSVLGKSTRPGHQVKANNVAACWGNHHDLVTKSKQTVGQSAGKKNKTWSPNQRIRTEGQRVGQNRM